MEEGIIILEFESANFDNMIHNWGMIKDTITFHVIVLVVEGKVLYNINNEEILLEKGEIMYIPKYSLRSGENFSGKPHQKYTILFHLEEERIDIPYLLQRQCFIVKPRNFEYFKQRAEFLYTDLRGNKKYNDFICQGILKEIIGMLAREKEENEIPPMKLKYAQDIQEYIMKHYRNNIEINNLAKLIQKSPNYTIAIFKEVTGQSPIQYLHHLRILEACNLLVNSNMDIAYISDYLGFYDTSYFSRTFKKIMSISPREYQKAGIEAKASNDI
ncbi:AraC family transcriptional regulator [Lederbergia wuyishanensis]|uniref:AraC-like DNA-binding protein n=1 Tax=Lederbergia wuyishanensis TaxID=1347903 RepID=A0ABU0D5K4_9BACI|nr:AraC family transcriptional regulator [Lederbergia wuyishanensis]MCJ8009819.1 AraC family transcriptional regulator [Lederbergia wuyishanensis]MDQ0343675.1 AraC-like DNA-binding protein [Lederbergia wuyishanensis]